MFHQMVYKSRYLRDHKIEQGIMLEPYCVTQHLCQQTCFTDKGYYYLHNGEINLCSVNQKDKADFRALECNQCHQEILLWNSGNLGWDQIFPIVQNENFVYVKNK